MVTIPEVIGGPVGICSGYYQPRVLLLQIDGKFPNLALMKLATYYRAKGWEVTRKCPNPDLVLASCVFRENRWKALGLGQMFPSVQVEIGGPGVDLHRALPEQVEHLMPAYDLWNVDFSMGFTTRGCIRNCPWCVVPAKEGPIRHHAYPSEFHDLRHRKIMFLDNNFLAGPYWAEHLAYVETHGLRLNINSGLDARLIDKATAEVLAQAPLYNWHFSHRQINLAYDTPEMKRPVEAAIDNLLLWGYDPGAIVVYVLVGFNTTLEQDLERVENLRSLGATPFVMRYNRTRRPAHVVPFARWVNRAAVFQSCRWQDYTTKTKPPGGTNSQLT
jgi:hypothetical protein